jgi:hypothetical protein
MPAPINMALYRVLIQTGASEADAEQAARLEAGDLVTKADLLATGADLRAEILSLEARLSKHITQSLIWLTAIYAGLTTMILALFQWAR